MDQHPKAPPGFYPDRVNLPPAAAEPAPRELVAAIMEIAERSRQIARALGVSEAMPWKDLVEHVQLLEDMRRALDDAFRMRDEQLGAALGYGGKELSGRTWDSLLADARHLAEGDNASYEEQMRMKFADALGLTRDPDEAPSWDELLGRVSGKRGSRIGQPGPLDAVDARIVELEGRVDQALDALGDSRVAEIRARLDALSRDLATHTHYSKIDPQVLNTLEARLDALAGTHERWKGTVDALSVRVTELHKHHENNALESQRRDEALSSAFDELEGDVERFIADRQKADAPIGDRLESCEVFQRAATQVDEMLRERIASLEAWRLTATAGDPAIPVAETNRARPGEGQFVHLSDLQIGDWIVFDGVPREVTGLSPEEVVVGHDGVGAVSIDRSGHALRLVWRPSRKERRRG